MRETRLCPLRHDHFLTLYSAERQAPFTERKEANENQHSSGNRRPHDRLKETFLHVLAHEIHHIMFSQLVPEEMSPRQYFFVNFAFEGLAVHFCNNAATPGKPAKYPGPMLGMDEPGWQFYQEQHEPLIQKVLADGEKAKDMTMEQAAELVSGYEQFTFTSLKTGETRKVLQYPTYYAGCCLWGSIDLALGKERLFEVLASYDGFLDAWKEAAQVLQSAQDKED